MLYYKHDKEMTNTNNLSNNIKIKGESINDKQVKRKGKEIK